jgi:hypothetical protein
MIGRNQRNAAESGPARVPQHDLTLVVTRGVGVCQVATSDATSLPHQRRQSRVGVPRYIQLSSTLSSAPMTWPPYRAIVEVSRCGFDELKGTQYEQR